MNEENRNANHLIHEKSPYLLQHAYNPVDWFPWGEEAFAKAKAEDKPIFLSIGYSTCHWCHVMERESFEDEEVAAILNQSFISIKVDKEERPDIDTIYMNVCQAMNGHGGWPLTILMTPEQKPFFAGTYLPKHARGQMYGLMELLAKVQKVWKEDKQRLLESADELTDLLHQNEQNRSSDETTLDRSIYGKAYFQYQSQFDSKYGGFGSAPKFPSPHNLMFLLRYAVLFHSDSALAMVEKTLESMYEGGIYDHIGGGFSRYSTDERWLVPHFEKMLYDNAMLVLLYCEAYQVTKRPLYENVARETLQYIMAEMTDENGGFYSAQDADSEGEEGKYYVFSTEEVIKVLGEKDGKLFNEFYQITSKGNFEGWSIPNRIGKQSEEVSNMKQMKEKLYEYRKQRMKLHKDDKILTSWNSLMIVAFAKAYQVFREDAYRDVAEKANAMLQEKLRDENHRIFVRYREEERYGLGNIDDYAYFVWAQLTLYEVTFQPSYLHHAVNDAKAMIELFWDEKQGGFFFYGSDAENLIIRPKEIYDGAIPSGNSVAAYVLQKLSVLTREQIFEEVARKQISFLSGELNDYPSAYSFALIACMLHLLESKEIVCVCKESVEVMELMQIMQHYFLPTTSVIAKYDEIAEELSLVAPYTMEYPNAKEEAEIYICENFSCHPPIQGMEALNNFLKE